MARFMATAEGRAKRLTRLGSVNFPAHATAQTWTVAAVSEAYADRHAKPDAKAGQADRLSLQLEALCQGCNRGHAAGKTVLLWDGSADEAEDLLGHNGPTKQAQAFRKAAQALQAKARFALASAPLLAHHNQPKAAPA